MGMYLNPGNMALRQDMSGAVYVDKSLLIAETNRLANTPQRFVCVSRARRFGKTMAGTMLAAYYSKGCDSRPLFDQLQISKHPCYEQYLNKLNVVKFDLNAMFSSCRKPEQFMEMVEQTLVEEFIEEFPDIRFSDFDTLDRAIAKVYSKMGEQFVIIIDEYDVLVRERVPEALFQSYLRFLNALFKNADLAPAIALAYLTGILPIVRDRVQSKLNLFEEYTMVSSGRLSSYFGFTSDEVKGLCAKYGLDYDECCRWYDGYHFRGVGEMFNPKSLVRAIDNGRCENFWAQSGSYEAVRDYIMLNFDGVKDAVVRMMGGEKVDVSITSFHNTMDSFHDKDDIFTYLLHIGYLAYDDEAQQCYIPNEEVRQQWVDALKKTDDYKEIFKLLDSSKALMNSLLTKDEEALSEALDKVHSTVLSPKSYNDEAAFQAVLGLAFFYANTKFTVYREAPGGKGYADLVLIPYLPNLPAVVVELKRGHTAEGALQQIKDRRYYEPLSRYEGNILFAGISYDPDTKQHLCSIEEWAQQ